ncbi:hypothetical protein AF49_05067, partial [Klebsiella pneumoniae MGH 63]
YPAVFPTHVGVFLESTTRRTSAGIRSVFTMYVGCFL